jgi:hypothetical protein
MLGITVGNESLDLLPSTRLDMEITNPFLQFDNQLTGDYSLPFEIRATPKNMKALGFPSFIQTRIPTTGIPCAVFDGQSQHSVGSLKIENPEINLLSANRAKISLYYLTGSAGFLQDIKDVSLVDADFGGARSFSWDGYNKATGTGFWKHIHDVMNGAVNAFDYAIYPVGNKSLAGSDGMVTVSTTMMNWVKFEGGQVNMQKTSTDLQELNFITVFPYLHYVLKQALAKVGWKVDGAIMSDPDFLKITMVGFQAIDWGYMSPLDRFNFQILGVDPPTHPANIVFDLADHLPDISISEFLIALKNRFGWWYDFDNRNKTIHIQDLQGVISSSVKDMTRQSSPLIQKKVAQTAKIYALKNEFVGEYANGAPDLANVNYQGSLNHVSDLPAASPALAANVYLIRAENNYYICRPLAGSDASTNTYTWQFYAYNVYDVVPTGSTDDITTKATCLGDEPVDLYMDLIPRMDFAGNWNALSFSDTTWGIHLLMYHGLRNNKQGNPIPFACSGIYDSTGVQVSNWSLAFKCEKFDGTQVGLFDTKWKTILDNLNNPETFEFNLYLERAEYLQLKFSDTILVDGVKMYLTKLKPTIPFTTKDGEAGVLAVEALRI